jgi:hypothetical protein
LDQPFVLQKFQVVEQPKPKECPLNPLDFAGTKSTDFWSNVRQEVNLVTVGEQGLNKRTGVAVADSLAPE